MSLTRQAVWLAGVTLLGLVWVLAYAAPRLRDLDRLALATSRFDNQRSAIAQALEGYAATRRDLPPPTPKTSSWISQNALNGLEDHLDFNNPYGEGRGAQVKLRALNAEQVSAFLTQLLQVNLVVKNLKLEDRDGDGRWELEIMMEVPL